MDNYLSELNEDQRKAVLYCDGPSLVVAGAGSGKTKVLTYKIAWLLNNGLPPYSLLALTFTNKAAREMKNRISSIVGEYVAKQLWMGTFHSVFSRILRREAAHIGFSSNFTIYDATDSKNLIKAIIKDMQLDDKTYRPGLVQNNISNAKNALITVKSYDQNKEIQEYDIRNKTPLMCEIYKRYQNRCLQAGAMDFDDLLLQTNILFRDNPDVLEKYSRLFRYVLVDEYQDTNFAQHLIIQRLCEKTGHICAVGDDAQSIYSFRGANIDNILKFGNIYNGCKIFKLERNYRSTKNIVNAANSLIDKNRAQIKKTIYSEKESGSKIKIIATSSDYEEAYTVVKAVYEQKRRTPDSNYSDTAILYRTNAQSRVLEDAFRNKNIPYRIYGGLSFYQRKEIKDVVSYFRLAVNPHDEEALKRIINYPTRGIGDTTVNKLLHAASENNKSLWSILESPQSFAVPINGGTARKLAEFRDFMDSFAKTSATIPADEFASDLVKRSGLMSMFTQDRTTEGVGKLENVQELLKGIYEFCDIRREEGNEHIYMNDFLAEISLLTDQDTGEDETNDKVTLMTVHAAKGLEFPNVFIVGMEEDLFPSSKANDNIRAIEEERRLFYVAITRAENNCSISYAQSRFKNGQTTVCCPSRFLRDLDSRYIEESLPQRMQSYDSFNEERKGYSQTSMSSSFSPKRSFSRDAAVPIVKPTPAERKLVRLHDGNHYAANTNSYAGIKEGMRVSHDRFGEGTVLSMEGEAQNTKALVDFDNFGEKQLLLKFARLKPLS